MKMKKLIFSVMLFCLGLTVTASAAVTYELGEDSDTITVKSDIGVNGKFLYLLEPDNDVNSLMSSLENGTTDSVITYFEQIKNKNVPFEKEINMAQDAAPGKYVLYFAGETLPVWYASYDYRTTTCGQIGLLDENYDTLMTQNIYYFCKNPERMKNSRDIARIVEAVKEKIVPGTITADLASCKLLEKHIEESLLYVNTANGVKLTVSELENLLENSVDPEIKALYEKMTDDGINAVLTQIAAASPASYEAFEKSIERCMIMGAIGYPAILNSDDIVALLKDYKDYINLDLTVFEGMSASKQATVAQAISNAKPTTAKEIEDIIDENKPQTSKPTTGGSNGGGGGGGGGGIPVKPATPVGGNEEVPPTETEPEDVPDVTVGSFSDMSGYDWAKDAVLYMSENGFVKGVSEKEFAPSKNITRAEFAAIIVRCMKYAAPTDAENVFADVTADFWGYEAIMTAYNEGIVSGSGEASFNPQGNITRQDMAVILHNVYKKNKEDVESDTSFDDFEDVADYAKTAVGALHGAGILNGSENKYNPTGLCTRAEAVQAIYGFLNAMAVAE